MQFRAIRAPFLFITAFLGLALTMACGGGSSAKNLPASIAASPTSISANPGESVTLSLSAATSSGAATSADYNFVSQNPNLATVNSAGQVCAGQWTTDGTTCVAATGTGQTNIIVTPQKGTGSAVVTVYVHKPIANLVPVAPTGCTSSTQVTNVKANAKDGNGNLIDPSTLGPISWTARDSTVVSFNNSANNYGIATAATPGQTQIYATLGNISSGTVTFTTCPIVSLELTASSASTDGVISLASAGTATLTAVATDSIGTKLENPPIQWVTSNSYSAALSQTAATSTVAATTLNYTVTGSHAGSTATVMVVCSPPSCNLNLPPIYGPSYVVKVSGSPAATVYAGATNSKTLVPIDISTNTAGTAITLPAKPNSFIMNKQGTFGLLGADSDGAMVLNSAGSITSVGANGRALAITPDGSTGLLVNTTTGYLYFVTLSSSSVTSVIPISTNLTSAAFTPDSNNLWLTDGSGTLTTFNTSKGVLKYTLTSPTNSAAFLANGPVGYVNGGSDVVALATCNPDLQRTAGISGIDRQTFGTPTMLRAIPNASGVVALDSSNVDIVKNVIPTQTINPTTYACTTSVTQSNARATLPTSPTVNYFDVLPDSSKAVVTTSSSAMYIVDLSKTGTEAVTTVTAGAGATQLYQGGAVSDSSLFYVGGTDGTVHKIDLSSGSDAQQISVGLKDVDGNNTSPNLVQVRYK